MINYWCIYLYGNSGTISKSNIILNNSPTNYGVVTLWVGNYILKECIFDQNKNNLIFINSGSTLELNNCYYLTGSYHSSLFNTSTNYYLHSIYFSYYCSYSNVDIIPIPTISIFKCEIFTCHCNNYYSLSIVEILSFLSFLIFFID